MANESKMILLEIQAPDGGNTYAAINLRIKDVTKANFPFAFFIDLKTEVPIKDLSVENYEDMQVIEDEIKNSFEENEAILVGHVSHLSKREILFYTSTEYEPDDFLLKLLAKDYFDPDIIISKDPNWSNVEAFLEKI